ncbi:hypothetical protein BKA67DRAFT_657272 [Truncatella angustata]|uniref:Uncharacterized protein n=1 Tax=Truncatella angustata TaxID=152316 RepID=A0A9P8UNT7_9PEZI|nr:uncharacterized protein BKA67DRAFT_657272 [Truncatella angustata]KAH6655324.1 hypothetical protein BKA67DRAFT_657272 [Truncatella angustata]KAH8205206.1 hypothetical protein TruAng_000618 [Truncatella angustata]
MNNESVGSLLAVIANSINDALRIMMFADKQAWGSDEFEQLRILEETLDEAKKDFQTLPSLINGREYYEHDRKPDSLEDLRLLCTRFGFHALNFKEWVRTGGPIDPTWARETIELRRELHRAQCRAARRIFNSEQETTTRCLGAFQVFRVQRSPENPQQRSLEELMACNETGNFERFGEVDIAFICDFCDGYIVWEDLREMPSSRTAAQDHTEPTSATSMTPGQDTNWQAVGFKSSDGEEKTVVFAPVAIANHMPPEPGEWQARILCPLCDDYYTEEQGEDDMDRIKWNLDEGGFGNMEEFREHLEWRHSASALPDTSNCVVM